MPHGREDTDTIYGWHLPSSQVNQGSFIQGKGRFSTSGIGLGRQGSVKSKGSGRRWNFHLEVSGLLTNNERGCYGLTDGEEGKKEVEVLVIAIIIAALWRRRRAGDYHSLGRF